MNALHFDLGERKHVRLEVFSTKKEDFIISEAKYELIKSGSLNAEDSGICTITDHEMDMLICPNAIGSYILRITYSIGDSTLIKNVNLKVERYGVY